MRILITGSNGQLGSEIKDLVHLYKSTEFIFTNRHDLDSIFTNKYDTPFHPSYFQQSSKTDV